MKLWSFIKFSEEFCFVIHWRMEIEVARFLHFTDGAHPSFDQIIVAPLNFSKFKFVKFFFRN